LPQAEPQQQLRVPELELSVAVRIFKDRYSVFQEPVKDKPWYVRFRQLSSKKTIQGMTHSKGTKISPRFLLQILERFGIGIPDFLEAIATAKKGPRNEN
jgi:hypothetical protein